MSTPEKKESSRVEGLIILEDELEETNNMGERLGFYPKDAGNKIQGSGSGSPKSISFLYRRPSWRTPTEPLWTNAGVILSLGYCMDAVGKIKGVEEVINVVNVYGPHYPNLKRSLWQKLSTLKSFRPGLWILLGDFNTVIHSAERFNSSFCKSSAFYCNQFIDEGNLTEYNMGDLSFKMFHSWLLEEGAYELGVPCQNSPSWSPDRRLLCRFKDVKKCLKEWVQATKLKEDMKAHYIRSSIAIIELAAESRPLTDMEKQVRIGGLCRLIELDFQKR
ncbi:hypothetical protein QVD17_41694 [Tagetes erecta]|uniref:Uncharacterized protein n=1 Tax=Tagetes erecta TaxID=13708 RepID=A0AAD8NF13_TARER|nr:hypothetical protein QVD17_41694 [Tagetes erecta]